MESSGKDQGKWEGMVTLNREGLEREMQPPEKGMEGFGKIGTLGRILMAVGERADQNKQQKLYTKENTIRNHHGSLAGKGQEDLL